jgi:hypothetical protein
MLRRIPVGASATIAGVTVHHVGTSTWRINSRRMNMSCAVNVLDSRRSTQRTRPSRRITKRTTKRGAWRMNPSDVHVRESFDRCLTAVRRRGVRSPEAVCAATMRKAYGSQFQKIAAQGRSLAAARRHAQGLVLARKRHRLVRRAKARLKPTAIERRGLVRRVIREQALAKRRAVRPKRSSRKNPRVFRYVVYAKPKRASRHVPVYQTKSLAQADRAANMLLDRGVNAYVIDESTGAYAGTVANPRRKRARKR